MQYLATFGRSDTTAAIVNVAGRARADEHQAEALQRRAKNAGMDNRV
jgi:hypothetical protein